MTSWLDPASPLPPEPVRRRVPASAWSPSREVLDEIRRQAGALDEGQADEVDEWRGQVIELERRWSQVIQQEAWSRATSHRWGESTLEVVDESHAWPVLTADVVEAWVSEALSAQLTDEQRALLASAYGPHSVHGGEVQAFRRYRLDIKRKRPR